MKQKLLLLFSLTMILALTLGACSGGGGGDDTTSEDGDTTGGGASGTVRLARATWNTGFFTAEIYSILLSELGYSVEDVEPLANDAFYISAARGDVDMWVNGWFPIHNTYLEDPKVQGKVELVGNVVKAGAIQGYLMDTKTSQEHQITNIEDLKNPEIAALFDSDGNGKANLIGCPEGWGCAKTINHQLEAYELGDTVEHVQGEYALLMGEVVSRYQRGEPILFYTWTPNWTVHKLKPGEDVVWLEVPFPSLTEDQKAFEADEFITIPDVEGCATGQSTCKMGWPYGDIRPVVNTEFINNNPQVRALLEQASVPFEDITAQNARMEDNDEKSDEDVKMHAQEWVDQHREQVDAWLEQARSAGS